jgi:hypothetical protein
MMSSFYLLPYPSFIGKERRLQITLRSCLRRKSISADFKHWEIPKLSKLTIVYSFHFRFINRVMSSKGLSSLEKSALICPQRTSGIAVRSRK